MSMSSPAAFDLDKLHEVAAKKRRTGGGRSSGGHYEAARPSFDFVGLTHGDVAVGADGHPDCTSSEDCLGNFADKIVRHMMNGVPGAVYCESCWKFFLEQNADLVGMYEDGRLHTFLETLAETLAETDKAEKWLDKELAAMMGCDML